MQEEAGLAGLVSRGLERLPGVRSARLHLTAEDREPSASARHLPVCTERHRYGTLEIDLTDPARYGPYDPFISNLANSIALWVENRRQREELERIAATQRLLYEQAQEAARQREEMLAVVSHDLKSPLASILLNAAALLEIMPSSDPNVRRFIETIERSGKRMSRLIRDLLDLDSIQKGRLPLEQSLHPAAGIIEELVENFRTQTKDRHISLIADHSRDFLPEVCCDRDRVLEVLDNLVSNAINVMPKGGTIRVRVEPSGGELRFSVADTGPGIAEDDRPHLFDRLWRAKNAHYKGTGRGLAIAKGIVEAHGGRIWVDSAIGVGTTFFFTLPSSETPLMG
jgi:signal transduction histidine kinase